MKIDKSLTCPKCNDTHFTVKREAAYLYSYKLNTPEADHFSMENEALPFLFDFREQLSDESYLECEQCKAQYPCDLQWDGTHIDFTILQKAVRSEFVTNPDFLG